MPGKPYTTPVTLYEIWRNILHDAGYTPGEFTNPPIELINLLKGADYGTFQTTLSQYGSGIDGTLTFSTNANGNAAVTLWNGTTVTASGNVFTLPQDLWLGDQSTVNSGAIITTAGFRVFCQGELINNGVIRTNGANGANNVAGAALAYASTISATTVGTAGGAGALNNGTNGTAATNAFGGVGGTGGASNNGTAVAGVGGTVTASNNTIALPFSDPYALTAHGGNGTAFQVLQAGSGGGSGSGDGTNNSGGGGGGGGILMIAAQRLTGNGTIEANGGVGGNAAAGNSGGGGGGGGGLVIVVSRSIVPKAVVSTGPLDPNTAIQALGGAGGVGAGTGTAGAVGANGTLVLLPA
jgi:hypothetical protein